MHRHLIAIIFAGALAAQTPQPLVIADCSNPTWTYPDGGRNQISIAGGATACVDFPASFNGALLNMGQYGPPAGPGRGGTAPGTFATATTPGGPMGAALLYTVASQLRALVAFLGQVAGNQAAAAKTSDAAASLKATP